MLKIKIDTDDIAKQFREMAMEVKQDLEKGVANLAAITHAKVAELANEDLHSSRQSFMDSLGFEEIAEGVWVVSIDDKGLWIEEGIEPNKDMKPDLLKDAKHTSKEGFKYRTIPFDYGKAPTQLTGYAQGLVSKIKANLKREGVPFKKIEKNASGSPRVGKLHSFNWNSEIPGKGNTPALKGVSIYQSITKSGNVRRDIMTFRTVSGSPASADKWHHPGMAAKKYLDKSMEWALKEWEEKILPEILGRYK